MKTCAARWPKLGTVRRDRKREAQVAFYLIELPPGYLKTPGWLEATTEEHRFPVAAIGAAGRLPPWLARRVDQLLRPRAERGDLRAQVGGKLAMAREGRRCRRGAQARLRSESRLGLADRFI